MRYGIALGRMHPSMFTEAAIAADELGFESLWFPEHLVLPVAMAGSPFVGAEHPPVPPSTPVFDVFGYLGFLAGRTKAIRLGTHVYNLALRHPFVSARAVQTADLVSGGRLEVGVGAGWLEAEWRAAGLDFASRGARLDEALEVCRRLWTEPTVEHHGRFFDFDSVMFEPKPHQRPHPPVIVGGESAAALRRAARHDGWIGLSHSPESVSRPVATLHALRRSPGADDGAFSVTVGGAVADDSDVDAYTAAGVDRLIVGPWARTGDVLDGLSTFARRFIG
ncbi:MAG TPA: TIGR03619 family F420-dependent LLM class oxidoreductase [Acidimicrobiales bacterium]|nr:TIGR03619 family F420-dependent LLM class oxidoreductase [Acidimicrobiales bacterium]